MKKSIVVLMVFTLLTLAACGGNGDTNGSTQEAASRLIPGFGSSSGSGNAVPMIAVGSTHTVALASDGTVWTWGSNGADQLGIGESNQGLPHLGNRYTPARVQGFPYNAVSIAAAGSSTLVLREDGTVWGWGENMGLLGDGTTSRRYTPVQARGLEDITAIAATHSSHAHGHVMAIRSDGTLWAWGTNWSGQLGMGTRSHSHNEPIQVQGIDGVTAIALGSDHSVALRSDGTVWAWGSNGAGQLGYGPIITENPRREGHYLEERVDWHYTPVQVQGLYNVTAIAAGGAQTFAVKDDGTVWAWGANREGQLGCAEIPREHFNYEPTRVQGLYDIVDIVTVGRHTIALRGDGTVWAWGQNQQAQLGDGTTMKRYTPVQVPELDNIVAIATGNANSMALRGDGTVWTWGQNHHGQLGNGDDSRTRRYSPIQVLGEDGRGYLNLGVAPAS